MGMIPERDIWRAANLMIREHSADAEIVAVRRADEMLERGDREGQIVWLRIALRDPRPRQAAPGQPGPEGRDRDRPQGTVVAGSPDRREFRRGWLDRRRQAVGEQGRQLRLRRAEGRV